MLVILKGPVILKRKRHSFDGDNRNGCHISPHDAPVTDVEGAFSDTRKLQMSNLGKQKKMTTWHYMPKSII